MASSSVTEDYYQILELEQNATLEQITKAYKRLALKRHPDRNSSPDATELFQRLGQAYDTLKDTIKRLAYDRIYSSINKTHRPPQSTDRTQKSSPQTEQDRSASADKEELKILEDRGKQLERQWQTRNKTLNLSILEHNLAIRRLEQEVKDIETILAQEVAEVKPEVCPEQTTTSSKDNKKQDNEGEEERKDRARQERKIEKDMKERRLDNLKAKVNSDEELKKEAAEKFKTAISENNESILQVKERVRLNQEQAQAEQRRKAQEYRQRNCSHMGWWNKVQGLTRCPKCGGLWRFLLQCPQCETQACPDCLKEVRKRAKRAPR